MNKIVFICHCILNQSTRAWWKTGEASRVQGLMQDVLEILGRYGVGAIQMECPEFSLYSNPRSAKSKEDYNTLEFRLKCKSIAFNVVKAIKTLELNIEYPTKIVAILGMEGSPSCGVERTTKTVDGSIVSAKGSGLLIETIIDSLKEHNLMVPFLGVSLRKGETEKQLAKLDRLLQQSTDLSK